MLIKLLLLIMTVPLVHLHIVKAENVTNVPVVQSLDVVYDIGLNSKISTTETIIFENNFKGQYIRRIPKKVVYTKTEERSYKKEVTGSYSVKGIEVFMGNTKQMEYKLKEDNDQVEVAVEVKDLPSEDRRIILKYEIDRAITEVEKKDEQNTRNNIELLGRIGVLSSGKEEYLIKSITAQIISPYAEIGTMECFAGDIENEQRMCLTEYKKDSGKSLSTNYLGEGKGFVISFKMMKGGDIKTPGKTSSYFAGILDFLRVNAKIIIICGAGLLLLIYFAGKIFYIRRIKN